MHGLEDLLCVFVDDIRQWRVRAHSAGVRAGVAVADSLVVAGRRERDGVLACRHREDGQLRPFQQLLDVEGLVVRRRHLQRGVELVLGGADPDALARREPVELDDARRLGDRERPRCRHAGGVQDVLRERLRALDLRGGGTRPEDGDPASAELVGEACDERCLGTDDDEVDPDLTAERGERGVVVGAGRVAVRQCGDSGVAGSRM